MFWTTLSPSARKGVSGDQKGPRMLEEVGAELPSGTSRRWLISSTRLPFVSIGSGIQTMPFLFD